MNHRPDETEPVKGSRPTSSDESPDPSKTQKPQPAHEDESVAGEEDPGAALDLPAQPPVPPPRRD